MNDEARLLKDMERAKQICLLDDEFMTRFFEDNIPVTEFVLKIILNLDLKVKSVETQKTIKNLRGRSVRLDICAETSDGKICNIEIQRQDKGAGAKRARYYAGILDSNALLPGDDFEKLPETYIIFITEKDVLKKNKPIYFIERTIKETGENFNDGLHIVYVNNSIKDDTPLGKLMHDFACPDVNKMNYKIISERARGFKEFVKGVAPVSKIFEEIREEGREEERKNFAVRLLEKGKMTIAEIAELCKLTPAEVNLLAESKSK